MKVLDSLYGNGPVTIARQHQIAEACAAVWGADLVETPVGAAEIDALFADRGCLVLLAEIRTRDDLTLRKLRTEFARGYLITDSKLTRCCELARRLGVPFALIVGLYPEGTIVWWVVTEPMRQQAERAWTVTKAGCNGGTARRLNAFLPLADMHVIPNVSLNPLISGPQLPFLGAPLE